jgi:hypothetical protein
MIGIPVKPEKLKALRRRFAQAVEPIYRAADTMSGAVKPQAKASHVFDFADGLRLMLNRERHADGLIVLHVIATAPGILSSDLTKIINDPKEMGVVVIDRFARLSEIDINVAKPRQFFYSQDGGIHVLYVDPFGGAAEITDDILKRARDGKITIDDQRPGQPVSDQS